jgi:hypothetical protein
MRVRRVVTGHDRNGKAVFASDQEVALRHSAPQHTHSASLTSHAPTRNPRPAPLPAE